MNKHHKTILLNLLKGIIIILINYIIKCYKQLTKRTIFEELSDLLSNLIKIFKFSITIGAICGALWYVCCILIFNNKTIFLKILGIYREIIVHEYVILLIHT